MKKIFFTSIVILLSLPFKSNAQDRQEKYIKDFKLPDQNGKFILTKQFRGGFFLINFWTVDCQKCVQDFFEFNKVANEYKQTKFKITPKGFNILNVNFDAKKSIWKSKLEKEKLVGNQVNDIKGFSGEIAKKYKILSPSNVLYNYGGYEIARNVTADQLRRILVGNQKATAVNSH